MFYVYESRISLGHGIIDSRSSLHIISHNQDYLRNEIKKFGIIEEELRKINPTHDDLLEIHSELITFGFSTKYFLNMQTIAYHYKEK